MKEKLRKFYNLFFVLLEDIKTTKDHITLNSIESEYKRGKTMATKAIITNIKTVLSQYGAFISTSLLFVFVAHVLTSLDTFPSRGIFDLIPETHIVVGLYDPSKVGSFVTVYESKMLMYLPNKKTYEEDLRKIHPELDFDEFIESKENMYKVVSYFEKKMASAKTDIDFTEVYNNKAIYRVDGICAPRYGDVVKVYNNHYFISAGNKKCILEPLVRSKF